MPGQVRSDRGFERPKPKEKEKDKQRKSNKILLFLLDCLKFTHSLFFFPHKKKCVSLYISYISFVLLKRDTGESSGLRERERERREGINTGWSDYSISLSFSYQGVCVCLCV